MEGMIYAGFWRRFGSIVIDTVGMFVLGGALGSLSIAVGSLESLILLVMYASVFLYSVIYLGGWKQSIGSRLLKIKVVTAHGGSVTIWRSALRSLVMWTPPAFLLIPFNRRRRALYDVLADTVVIKLPPEQ